MEQIKILVVDDHALFRQGLSRVLEMEKELAVVGEAENGEDAIRKVAALQPDVVLMDINMPSMNGIEATREIKKRYPDTKVIILSIHEDDEYVFEVVRAGANGYVLKDVAPSELVQAIRNVYIGRSAIAPQVAAKLLHEFNRITNEPEHQTENDDQLAQLTKREKEVLCLLAQGRSNRQIAHDLFISEKTVKNHISSLFRKLGVDDRTQAALLAVKLKLVEIN